MSYIIGKNCVEVCDSECVSVCPVDCIHGPIHNNMSGNELTYLKETGEIKALKSPQLYINPTDCISCGACQPVCPVDAIYESEEVAIQNDDLKSVERNYSFFGETFKQK